MQVIAFDNLGREPSMSERINVSVLLLNDFQRVRIIFGVDRNTIMEKQDYIIEYVPVEI